MTRRLFYTRAYLRSRKPSEARVPLLPVISNITGDIDNDGLHRFELDWYETAEWTKSLLESMRDDRELLAKKQKEFIPYSQNTPLCFKKTAYHSFDFSKRPATHHPATLLVKVSELQLKPDERRRFLLLAGEYYDPELDVVTLDADIEGNCLK